PTAIHTLSLHDALPICLAPNNLLAAVDLVPNVAAADLRATYYTKWHAADAWKDIQFIGIRDFQDMRVNRVDLVAGQWPRAGEVVLEASVQDVAPVQMGD